MADLQNEIALIITEIKSNAEKSRRAYALRRHKIYRDGGREFLIEALETEFPMDAIKEFRLCTVNYLKKLVLKKSLIYKNPPIRKVVTQLDSDQKLVDFYTNELAFNIKMRQANEYYNLQANTALYVYPKGDFLEFKVVPPHLYSIVPDPYDRTKVKVWAFNNFAEASDITKQQDLPAATGHTGFDRTRNATAPNTVDSNALVSGQGRNFILWSDVFHATLDEDGRPIVLDPEKGMEQFINPIQMAPVVHLQKQTDNEAWSTAGEDAVDITILLQRMWTDLATVIKHQGFGQLVIISEERPEKLEIGITKGMWLKRHEGKDAPEVKYLTADSRISEIKETIRDLTFILFSTNEVNPSAVGKSDGGATFNSGIQAMLEMSDAYDAMKADQPTHADAEKDVWQIISRYHNYMLDLGILREDARSLGKFSEAFDLSVIYQDIKPMVSDQDKLNLIKDQLALKIITRQDALKSLHPDWTDEEIQTKLQEIDTEMKAISSNFMSNFNENADNGVDLNGEDKV